MGCELPETHLHGYFDGELDAAGTANFERHLELCKDCAAAVALQETLRHSLRQAELYEPATEDLRRKIRSHSSAVAASRPVISSAWRWLALAATLLLAVLLGWRQFSNQRSYRRQNALAAAAVDAHLRSLQPGHLTDVDSTDQHTVKPWFDGKLDIAPPVRDFVNDGFRLTGGRLDVIDGQPVAALVYGRRKHIVNVFVWKAPVSPSLSGVGEQQGYHWVTWEEGGFAFCAVSDVSTQDLQQLQQLFVGK
jgi:anti-sigma factor RsiW